MHNNIIIDNNERYLTKFLRFLNIRWVAIHTDPIRPEVVDEIFEDIHHVGGDIVEGNGVITAAGKTFFLWVIYVLIVPTTFVYKAWTIHLSKIFISFIFSNLELNGALAQKGKTFSVLDYLLNRLPPPLIFPCIFLDSSFYNVMF